MSAYGAISTAKRPLDPLRSTIWLLKRKVSQTDLSGSENTPEIVPYLTIHHLTLQTANDFPDLIPYLHESFAEELERGLTYPQEIIPEEPYTQSQFEAYFFAGDVLLAVIGRDGTSAAGNADGSETPLALVEAKIGRSWEDCIAGFYYEKA